MKLTVTASRHWTDRDAMWSALDEIDPRPSVLIHGGAPGGDTFAGEWARCRGVVCAIVRPVNPQIRSDYLARNTVSVDLGDKTIAFRAPGKSNGTDDAIRKAKAAGKLLRVVEQVPS